MKQTAAPNVKKTVKRIASLFLALLICLTATPRIPAAAAANSSAKVAHVYFTYEDRAPGEAGL